MLCQWTDGTLCESSKENTPATKIESSLLSERGPEHGTGLFVSFPTVIALSVLSLETWPECLCFCAATYG
jgi:hypothetical protein